MYNGLFMGRIPLVILATKPGVPLDLVQDFDTITTEDPLPSPVDVSATGIVTARVTRITEVKPETTDDK